MGRWKPSLAAGGARSRRPTWELDVLPGSEPGRWDLLAVDEAFIPAFELGASSKTQAFRALAEDIALRATRPSRILVLSPADVKTLAKYLPRDVEALRVEALPWIEAYRVLTDPAGGTFDDEADFDDEGAFDDDDAAFDEDFEPFAGPGLPESLAPRLSRLLADIEALDVFDAVPSDGFFELDGPGLEGRVLVPLRDVSFDALALYASREDYDDDMETEQGARTELVVWEGECVSKATADDAARLGLELPGDRVAQVARLHGVESAPATEAEATELLDAIEAALGYQRQAGGGVVEQVDAMVEGRLIRVRLGRDTQVDSMVGDTIRADWSVLPEGGDSEGRVAGTVLVLSLEPEAVARWTERLASVAHVRMSNCAECQRLQFLAIGADGVGFWLSQHLDPPVEGPPSGDTLGLALVRREHDPEALQPGHLVFAATFPLVDDRADIATS